MVFRSLPVAVCHNLILESLLPERICLPSGENATELIGFSVSLSDLKGRPV